MDYLPWPENGCPLAEARWRTADRSEWSRLDQDEGPGQQQTQSPHGEANRNTADVGDVEDNPEADFRQQMTSRQLVAYGHPGHPQAPPQLIRGHTWQTIPSIDWANSSIGDDRRVGNVFFKVRVIPALLAPCGPDLLDRSLLSEAFKRFVLGDPEVAALARAAVTLSSKYQGVFIQGRCTVHGVEEWPVAHERWTMIGTVHPEPAKRSRFDDPRNADPLEVIIAAEALKHRYRALMSLLRRGELQGYGLATFPGHPSDIPRSVWSRREFHIDAISGDVLQDNPESVGRNDRLVKRWIGVLLQKTSISNRHMRVPASSSGLAADPAGSVDGPPFTIDEVVQTGSLSLALSQLVFGHPIVRALRAAAMEVAEGQKISFEEDVGLVGIVSGHGEPLFPLRHFPTEEHDFSSMPLEPLTPEEEIVESTYFGGPPPEIQAYYDAVNLHAQTLIEMLQTRELVGLGHTLQGDLVQLAQSIWSHEDFYVHPPTGDVYEAGYGEMVKKWTGVVLTRPDDAPTFHVKAIAAHGVPSTTIEHPSLSPKPGKALATLSSSNASRTQCAAWIADIMQASPDKRTESRKSLWNKARKKWPNTLSERSFLSAWGEAVRMTNAIAWSAAGAPKKSPHGNRGAK